MRVLEISDREQAAAYAGKLFRRWGAEVIKLESPARPPPDHSLDIYLNGGKRRVALDLTSADGRTAASRLAAEADVLLTDHSPRQIEEAGLLDLGGAVRTAITPFGLSGPYRDHEATSATLLALGGYTWLMGDKGRAPLTMPGNYVYYQGGAYAYICALAALLSPSSAPVRIEVSLFEALISLHQFTDTMWTFGEVVRSRHGNRWENLCPTTLLECHDGWYGLNILQNFWFPFAQMIGHPEMTADHPWATNQGRMEDEDGVEALIKATLWDKPRKDIFREAQETWRVPVGYAATLDDLLADPHLGQRAFWRPVRLHEGQTLQVPGSPFRIVGEDPPLEEAPLPAESSPAWQAAAQPRTPLPSADPARPLASVRVLDLTRIWSGPLATRILGDLGAEVIKIEAHDGRGGGFGRVPGVERPWNRQPLFNKLSRNKKSIAIDLKSTQGRRIFLDLVKVSDVVIENFSARAMPSLGLAYEDMRAVNDRIIYVAMPAFGMYGPYRDYVGLGPSIEPVTGMTALMGYGDDEPRVTSKALTDAISGVAAASAVVTALWKRDDRGAGFAIDLSQHETGIAFLGEHFVETQLSRRPPQRIGNRHREWAPHGVYACAGDDQWLALAARDDAEWQALCRVLGLTLAARDPRLATAAGRRKHAVEVDAAVEAATRAWDKRSLESALQAAHVPAGAVLSAPEYLSDPHLLARDYFVSLVHKETGPSTWDGTPARFDGLRGYPHWVAAPLLGADNRALMRDLLGLDDAAVERLYRERVLAEAPPER